MTIDLTGVSPQVAGFYNSGVTAGRSAAEVVFKCITAPLLLPINDGSFRPLKIILPPGRVVSAVKPAPVRVWMTVPMTVSDTLFKALAQACPERTIAAHYADLCIVNPQGFDAETGRYFWSHIGHPGGGWGAKSDQDGMNATVALNDGDTHNSPVEATEAKSPIIVERRGTPAGFRRRGQVPRRTRRGATGTHAQTSEYLFAHGANHLRAVGTSRRRCGAGESYIDPAQQWRCREILHRKNQTDRSSRRRRISGRNR